MKYIKKFESEDTNYGYKSMDYEGNIIIDLKKFNNYNRLLYITEKKDILKEMIVDKVIGFRGRHSDNFFNDKKIIKNILYSYPSYIFYADDNTKYTIDNEYPITIYTLESDALKYNL